MVNFLFEKWGSFECIMCAKVCVLFNVSMFVYVLLLLRMYWHSSVHIYTYFHCLLLRRGEMKEEWVRRGWRNELWQSE